jgi:hypothetical protein
MDLLLPALYFPACMSSLVLALVLAASSSLVPVVLVLNLLEQLEQLDQLEQLEQPLPLEQLEQLEQLPVLGLVQFYTSLGVLLQLVVLAYSFVCIHNLFYT